MRIEITLLRGRTGILKTRKTDEQFYILSFTIKVKRKDLPTELRELFDKGTATRDAFKMWHFMLGLSVLALASIRLIARIMGGSAPDIKPSKSCMKPQEK